MAPRDADEDDEDEGKVQPNSRIVISAHRLDAARTQIDAGLGATVYSLTNDAIENRPSGETGTLADILTQAPGATFVGSTLSIRGAAANQVRINNVIVPEAIPDPADLLSSRLAETTRLITGALPAQFGFAPGGVISVTTKNGLYQHGGQAEFFAGTDGMVQPAFEWAGSASASSLFASGEIERDRSTVADASGDRTREGRTGLDGLGFADHVIDENDRLSFLFGGSHERRKFGETSIGSGVETSDDAYGVATLQHSDGPFTLQTSLFAGLAADRTEFGVPSHERRGSWGSQIDGSYALATPNTLRFGLLVTRSNARELNLIGNRSSDARTAVEVYAQDEWKLSRSLTFNPGARVEWPHGLASGTDIEPRASLVWQSPDGLTAHLGYARYVSSVPVGDRASHTALPDERDDSFDAGLQQKLAALTFGIDAYWRSVHDYIAQHQIIGSPLSEAFGFKRARIGGVELSATYARGGTTAWTNLSLSSARAKSIVGGEDLFDPATLEAASAREVPLASERPASASAGFTQRVGDFTLGADVLVSSGTVRTLEVTAPNGARSAPFAVFGLTAVYHATLLGQPADLRLDLTNVTNVHYRTSDASSLEGGWTQVGRARAVTVGIEQGF